MKRAALLDEMLDWMIGTNSNFDVLNCYIDIE